MRKIVKVRVKKIISQCPKNNASHEINVFVEHILREFVTHVYSSILHLYKVFGDKVYLRKENSSVLLLIWKTYNQCLQMIVKVSNMLQKATKICFQISDSFSWRSYNKHYLTKYLFKSDYCVIYRQVFQASYSKYPTAKIQIAILLQFTTLFGFNPIFLPKNDICWYIEICSVK